MISFRAMPMAALIVALLVVPDVMGQSWDYVEDDKFDNSVDFPDDLYSEEDDNTWKQPDDDDGHHSDDDDWWAPAPAPSWHKPTWHKPTWHKPTWHKPTWHPKPYHKPTHHKPTKHPVSKPTKKPVYASCNDSVADIACGGSYSILCAAIKKVGLYRELNDRYQDYTAFFPTNNAFEQFLDYMNVDNVGDLPSRTLEDVILLHVHSGREINKNQLKKRCSDTLKMANGDQTRTQCSSNKNQIYQKGNGNPDNDRPQIIKFDRHACNGIVHTVDEVILPGNLGGRKRVKPKDPTRSPTHSPTKKTSTNTLACDQAGSLDSIAEVACSSVTFSILCDAVTKAGLADVLGGNGSFTVFAPTNDAFEMLGASTLEGLLADPEGELKKVLLYHVADGKLMEDDLECGAELPMLNSDPFTSDFSNTVCQELGKYQIGNGNVFGMWPLIIEADLETCNGVIHVVDDVLIPKPDNGN